MVETSSKILLTRKALVLGALETTYNTNPGLSGTTDAALVSDPDYKIDAQILKRNFVQEDLSPLGSRVGRKIASLEFGMEFRSNGLTQSGALADECKIGRFIRACGYEATSMTGAAAVGALTPYSGNTVDPSWANAGTSVVGNKTRYRATVVVGGASATAEIRFTGGVNNDVSETAYLKEEAVTASVTGTTPTITLTVDDSDPLAVDITVGGAFQAGDVMNVVAHGVTYTHTVVGGDTNLDGVATAIAALIDAHALIVAGTTAAVVNMTYAAGGDGVVTTSAVTALDIGSSGLTMTPTWAASLVLGDYWDVIVYPQGILYLPRSDDFESLSMEAFFDGVKHEITGCYGTFTIEADAGNYATISFTFTGQYVAPVDEATPTATHETTVPPIVELAQLILGDNGDFQPVVAKFTFDQANTIAERPDVNSADGYNGVRLTEREPKGGIDPEATLVADYDFWGTLAASTQTAFTMRIGSVAGNRILMNAPKVQYTGLAYSDRNGIRALDAAIEFTRDTGNDEFEFVIA